MSITTIGVLLAFLAFLLGLVVIALGARYLGDRAERDRIQAFVIDRPGSVPRRGLSATEEDTGSRPRVRMNAGAWIEAIAAFLGRYAPQRTLVRTDRSLVIAGNPYGLRARSYYGVRIILMIVGLLLAVGIYRFDASPRYLLLALCVVLVSLIVPTLWLRAAMRRRQTLIRRSLPDALDMLSVITAAGLGFDQAMLRLGQSFRTPIGQEFARVVAEIEMGVSRGQALREMRARVDIPELSSFVAVILQSEQLGMSIADVLHSQAEQMRINRQFRAKEIAQQLPARMMIPLALFIFPALLAVILGPFLPVLMEILQ